MKKLIGIAVIPMTMFFSTNSMNSSDLDLVSLIALNTANAESDGASNCKKSRGSSCGVITGCKKTTGTDTCSTVVA